MAAIGIGSDPARPLGPVGPLPGAPLRHEDGPVGHLQVGRTPGAAPFSEQDAHAMELLAEFVATAIRNANLVADVKRQAGRTIVVSAGPGEVGVVRFSVSDTGPGLTADAAAHVFERGWQEKEH
jgi:hypothetical protein